VTEAAVPVAAGSAGLFWQRWWLWALRRSIGSVVIAVATRRLLGDRFRLQALGRHEIKGLTEPVAVWAIEGVSASESRFEAVRSGRLTDFVGREHELGLLMERWNLAQDGEGQVALLSGEPGIGKSRILSELRGRLEAQHALSLRLQWSPYYIIRTNRPSATLFGNPHGR
jgi:hypothetical protein